MIFDGVEQMKKRFQVVRAKPGTLIAKFGRAERDDQPSVCYAWGGEGASKADAHILSQALEGNDVFENCNLVEELKKRGYDITTMKFSISKLNQESN